MPGRDRPDQHLMLHGRHCPGRATTPPSSLILVISVLWFVRGVPGLVISIVFQPLRQEMKRNERATVDRKMS
jgi:hypothetical protein